MNPPSDAPNLLHKNPETDEESIHEEFMALYRLARQHFCYRILSCPFVDSVWEATMRPKWTLDDHNPIQYEGRLDQIISQSWHEIRPATQQADTFIELDPTLLDVHGSLTHTFDVRKQNTIPKRVAIYNLRMWVTQGLYHFWKHRLNGSRFALFNVRSDSVELRGVVPKSILEVYADSHDDCSCEIPYKYV